MPPFIDWIKEKADTIIRSLPKLTNRGKLVKALDPARHPSFVYSLENPTTAAAPFDPLKKGLNNLQPQPFYGLNARIIIWAPKTYFNHLGEAAAVRCPLCQKPAALHGWGQQLRRVCGL